VTSAQIADHLTGQGLAAAEHSAKASLYDSVLSTLADLTSRTPERILWVPGRLEVFGTHTDYAGGRTLIAAVPRGFAFAAVARTDNEIRLVDARDGETVTIPTSAHASAFTGWRRYCAVLVERLVRNFPGASLGADIVFASDLPRASGMSSSSALIVGAARLLARRAGLDERPEWKAAIHTPVDEAAYYACIESGLAYGAFDGDAGVGTHGGSEDHVAMLCARPGRMVAYAFVPVREIDHVDVPDAWRIVVMSSGVASEKGGNAQAAYNALASGAAALLDLWNQSAPRAPSLGAAMASNAFAAARLGDIVRNAHVDGWTADALERRLQHFLREDARVTAAVRAFRDADAWALAAIAADSQQDAESLLGNQVPETVLLPRLAHECGAFAARSFGAGFGGSVWALVNADDASAFAARWLTAYREHRPASAALAFVATPGPPLTELT
jgi:galactokinase